MKGFSFYGGHAGIKKNEECKDLGIIVAPQGCHYAVVFTQNQIQAAPVVLSQAHYKKSEILYAVICNSGNANACTGAQGHADALAMCSVLQEALYEIDLSICIDQIQVCSTGVIGAPLPIDSILSHIPYAMSALDSNHTLQFAEAIMTTDTRPKMRSLTFTTNRVDSTKNDTYTLWGAVKGAGMIHPNMATMLAFICTDAPIPTQSIKVMWQEVCDQSFNAITIDGDTSTNDTALFMSSGVSLGEQDLSTQDLNSFQCILQDLALSLALDILRDGEGVHHVVHIEVKGAHSIKDARQIAQTIALSPLVKTAIHGKDPNWGRIIAAIGRSQVKINPQSIDLSIEDTMIYKQGTWQGEASEVHAHTHMCTAEYKMTIDLHLGEAACTVYGTDLSKDYVSINADYRS